MGVLDDVGERLGDHEVGGRLDRLAAAGRAGSSASSTSIGARPASASSAGAEAAVGQDRGVDAARELAQLGERERELLLGAVEQLVGPVGVLVQLALGEPQRQRERDEPLLGAVVQVALQPPALLRAGLDDPGARGAQLLDAGAQLGLQALVLHREAGGGRDRAQQLGVLAAASRRARSRPTRRPSSSTAVHARAVSPSAGSSTVWPSESTHLPLSSSQNTSCERAVAERVRQPAAQVAGAGRLAEPQQQLRHRAGADHAAAHEADQEHPRDRREDDQAGVPSTSVSRETPAASDPSAVAEQHQHRDAGPQHRRQRAPLRRRGGAPAPQQDHEHDRDDRDADHRRDAR